MAACRHFGRRDPRRCLPRPLLVPPWQEAGREAGTERRIVARSSGGHAHRSAALPGGSTASRGAGPSLSGRGGRCTADRRSSSSQTETPSWKRLAALSCFQRRRRVLRADRVRILRGREPSWPEGVELARNVSSRRRRGAHPRRATPDRQLSRLSDDSPGVAGVAKARRLPPWRVGSSCSFDRRSTRGGLGRWSSGAGDSRRLRWSRGAARRRTGSQCPAEGTTRRARARSRCSKSWIALSRASDGSCPHSPRRPSHTATVARLSGRRRGRFRAAR